MKNRTSSKLKEQILDFPILGLLQYQWRWRQGKRWRQPKMNMHVQVADPESMHLQASNFHYLDLHRGYIGKVNDETLRGARLEYMIAVNHDDMEIAKLLWERGDIEKMSKDIFQIVPSWKVSYLVWVSAIEWYKVLSSEIVNDEEYLRTEKVNVDLDIIVFKKPRDKSFQELIEIADREKKEREEAYKYFPKEMPGFEGIHKALVEGCRLHAFSSGGGLRVLRLEKDEVCKGYGEHPHVEEALKHLDEDFLAGGRPYRKVYGKLHPHYLTGASLPISNIDAWVRRGSTFDCWYEEGEIVFELKGYVHNDEPEWVLRHIEIFNTPAKWSSRGHTYETGPDTFPSGKPCLNTHLLSSKVKGADPWMWHIKKTGRGKDLWDAMEKAFDAPEVEIEEE